VGQTAVCQYLIGFWTFVYPGAKVHTRLLFRPIHVKIGQFIFGLSVATALMGINQELRIKHEGSEGLTSEGLLGNVTGLMIVFLALLVFYIITRQAYHPESREKSDLLLP
jgi:cytochrome b-561